MYSEMMKILPSGARDNPRYKTTLGCRASLEFKAEFSDRKGLKSNLLHQPPFTFKILGDIIFLGRQHFFDSNVDPEIRS